MADMRAGLIADIIGSRRLSDRVSAQQAIFEAFGRAARLDAPDRELWSTVGDEFQAVLPTVGAAVRTTTVVRLALPDDVDLRFGIGWGKIWDVTAQGTAPIQDGAGWWSARRAIEETLRRQKTGSRYLRTWFVDGEDNPDPSFERMVDAHLLLRDMAISSMSPRQRRITLGTLEGHTQAELAEQEGITQGAVSQNLARSGAGALLASLELVGEIS